MRSLTGRVGVGVVSQAVSSGSNMAVTVIAARSLSPDDFGLFSLAFVMYVAVSAITRSALLEAALVRSSPAEDSDRLVTGAVAVVSFGWVAVIGLVGLVVGGEMRAVFLSLAVSIVPLLMVDAGRILSFSRKLPTRALSIDALWAALAVGGAVMVSDLSSPSGFILGWGLSSVAGALMTLKWTGRPILRTTWIQRSWPLGWRYTLEWFAGAGSSQVATIGLGAITGLAGLAGLRGAQLLFGPLNVLFSGVAAVLVPDGAGASVQRLRRLAVLASIGFTVLSLLVTTTLLLLPNEVGQFLLGGTWSVADDLILPVGLSVAAGGTYTGPLLGMRARRAARFSLRLRLAFAPALVVIPLICASVWGASGFAWAVAGTMVMVAVAWWVGFEMLLRNHAEEFVGLAL
jgi:O-antigen/teichoic acid export membrane protein